MKYEECERRRVKRFDQKLPITITRAGAGPVEYVGLTENIGTGGVLFGIAWMPVVGEVIEYVVTFGSKEQESAMILAGGIRGNGYVLRVEPTLSGVHPFRVAATLQRFRFQRERAE